MELVNLSEGNADGVGEGIDNLRISPNPICANSCSDKTLFTNSRNSKSQNKSFHHLKGSVPLFIIKI
jgi:hypothetical protein